MEKGCKNHRETLYSSKGKIVYVVGKPYNIYRLRGKPYDNYRISPEDLDLNRLNLSFVKDIYVCSWGKNDQKWS